MLLLAAVKSIYDRLVIAVSMAAGFLQWFYDIVNNRTPTHVVHARHDERARRGCSSDAGSSHLLSWEPFVDEFL